MKLTAPILAAVAVLALSGCSAIAPVSLPNGEQGYTIICFRQIAACYNDAAKLCKGGPWHMIDNSRAMAADPQIIIACGKGDKA